MMLSKLMVSEQDPVRDLWMSLISVATKAAPPRQRALEDPNRVSLPHERVTH